MRRHLVLACLGVAACGESSPASVTFEIHAPVAAALSPLADPRRDSAVLFDETTGRTIGSLASLRSGSFDFGTVEPGHYDAVRMDILGAGRVLGLARTRNVDIPPSGSVTIHLHARKPLIVYGHSVAFPGGSGSLPTPDRLMLMDSTLGTDLPPATQLADPAIATGSTHDGRLLLAASAVGEVAILDTATLHEARPRVMVIQSPEAGGAAPSPRQIVVSPDDRWAVVVTDQGIAPFQPGAHADGERRSVATIRLPSARAAAFDRVGRLLAVLAGPSSRALDCRRPDAEPARYYVFEIREGALQMVAGPTMVPFAATDIAFTRDGQLVFAVPCGAPQVAGITGTEGVYLAGRGIHDVVVVGDKVIGVGNIVAHDASGDGFRGEFYVRTPAGPQKPVPFQVPAMVLSLRSVACSSDADCGLGQRCETQQCVSGNGAAQVLRVSPSSDEFVAYRAASTPDGNSLVFASRTVYEVSSVPFIRLYWGDSSRIAYECTATARRAVYRITQLDLATGALQFEATRGVHDLERCRIACRSCDSLGQCAPSPVDESCAAGGGFVPDGLSVLMGPN